MLLNIWQNQQTQQRVKILSCGIYLLLMKDHFKIPFILFSARNTFEQQSHRKMR